MNESAATPDDKPRDGLSFIHSSLDDYGLTSAQFRVYCHVSRAAGRNGKCYQALGTIARHSGYCKDVAREALHFLTIHCLLSRKHVSGRSNEYRLNPPSEWAKPVDPIGENQRGAKIRAMKNSEESPQEKSQGNGSEKIPPKGIPSEDIHKGGVGQPVFEPVKRGLYRREYEGMIQDAEAELKKVKQEPALRDRRLKADVLSNCTWLREQAKENPEKASEHLRRVTEIENDPASYGPGQLTAEGRAVVKAWQDRINEIRNAMNGVIGGDSTV